MRAKFISLLTIILVLLHHKFASSSSSSSSSSGSLCSADERSALLNFKKAFIINEDDSHQCDYDEESIGLFDSTIHNRTTGRSFPKTKYWNVESDCCSWLGVTCDEISGHVIELDLSCSQLQGVIYSNNSLFRLIHLQNLNLAFNDFTGSYILSEFGQFPDLMHLNLSLSYFSGEIPSELSNLSKLVALDLSIGYPIASGFSSQVEKLQLKSFDVLLQRLKQLRTLVLDAIDVSFSNANTSKPHMGENLSYSLTYLSLRGCQFENFPEDIFHSPSFRRLHSLDLYYAKLPGAGIHDSISSLKSLKYLDLSLSLFGGIFPTWIGNLTKLTHLDLSLCSLGGQISSTSFSNLVHLEFLGLSSNGFKGQIPNSFANLTKLKFLNLGGNSFTGGFPSSFANLSQLDFLSISYNHLTQIPALTSGFQSLTILDLSSNALTGTIPSWIYTRPSLMTLNLQENHLSREISHEIGNLLNLSKLDLSSNSIGGIIPPSLFRLPSIETIHLSNNFLFGPLPSNITGFRKLTNLDLSNNTLNSTIPSTLLALPSLMYLDLSKNNFTGHVGDFKSSQLKYIDLSNNNLQSIKFSSFSKNLANLTSLDLSSNNISGSFETDFLLGLQELSKVDLSYNNHLSLISSSKMNFSPLPKLVEFRVSKCNVTAFPFFLKSLVELDKLDLSNNRIHGPLPEWLGSIGKSSLTFLNLSHNFLTGSFEILPWGNLTFLDLSFNLIQGKLPIPPATTFLYFVSNNKLSGEIHRKFCDLSSLWLVNLSNNSLSGNIPNCLLKNENLSLLNLRRNNLSGTIPETCGDELTTLDLSHNQLEGRVPRTLVNCTSLKILDLGYNLLSDIFPHWLGTLPELKILILSSNRFHGSLANSKVASTFTRLKVIDLSCNEFSGNLPSRYFQGWKSMMMISDNSSSPDPVKGNYYSDTVTIVNKGLKMELVRTLNLFKAVDFSNNKFEGKIPESIGNLKSLVVLNLSSNSLTGKIPPSLGELTQLESLDFSKNKLSGKIPEQLQSLTFLGAFDVSRNNLEGPVPQTGQLSTFPYDSYKENPGLCGIPLPKKCDEVPTLSGSRNFSPEQEDRNSDTIFEGFTWKSVTAGYGFGAIIGIVVGNVIIRRNEEWFLSIFNIRLIWRINLSTIIRRE